MQISFSTPERCLLVQAAHWFIDGTEPLPDEIYLSAPVELKTENSEMRELFLALKAGDFDVGGELVVEFRKYEKVPLDAQQKEVSCAGPFLLSGGLATLPFPEGITPVASPRDMYEEAKINIGRLNIDDFDFANNKIKINTIWLDDHSEFTLTCFIENRYPRDKGWVYECFFRDVTVDFSKLSASPLRDERSLQQLAKHGTKKTANQQRLCERWLVDLMQGGKPPEMPKDDYQKKAQEGFAVSQRGFVRAWANAIKETGNLDWSKPGPKS